jgi:hypothetical protein
VPPLGAGDAASPGAEYNAEIPQPKLSAAVSTTPHLQNRHTSHLLPA